MIKIVEAIIIDIVIVSVIVIVIVVVLVLIVIVIVVVVAAVVVTVGRFFIALIFDYPKCSGEQGGLSTTATLTCHR